MLGTGRSVRHRSTSSLVPGGFHTTGVGFGHVRVRHDRASTSRTIRSPRRSGCSSRTGWRWNSRRASRWRSASTTATTAPHARPRPSAVRTAAGAAPRHVRDERPRRRRCGVRPGVGGGTPDPERPRPARQRRDVQLLRPEPSRLPGRGRPRCPRRSTPTGTTTAATTGSASGATSRCARHERAPTPTARSTVHRCDVTIVGCGPVGIVLAILLAQRGRTVTVLERWPEPYPMPRAVHFDDEVGRILQSCGIGDAARSDLRAGRRLRMAQRGPARRSSASAGSGTGAAGGRRRRCSTSRRSKRCSRRGRASCRRSTSAGRRGRRRSTRTTMASRSGPSEATVQRSPCAAATPSAATARTARSATCVGVPMHDLGFFYDWLIVDVILDEPRVFDPINLQVCDPARPTTAVSGGPGRRRWEFMRLPDEDDRRPRRHRRGVEAARRLGRARRTTPARTPRRLHVPGAVRRATGGAGGCSSPATPPT